MQPFKIWWDYPFKLIIINFFILQMQYISISMKSDKLIFCFSNHNFQKQRMVINTRKFCKFIVYTSILWDAVILILNYTLSEHNNLSSHANRNCYVWSRCLTVYVRFLCRAYTIAAAPSMTGSVFIFWCRSGSGNYIDPDPAPLIQLFLEKSINK